jgi:DNA excision repair protein ERCC-2
VLAARSERLAASLPFPFEQPRPGQDVMIRDIADAARAGLMLLCSAPTGIGKTAAALFPMLQAGLREGRALWFLTAKVSQQELALQTLRRMLPSGGEAYGLQIAAKHRSCPLEQLDCRARRCPLQRRFRTRLRVSGLLDELARRGVVDAAHAAQRAVAARLCPFEVSLALAREASVVVADYNYAFDPGVRLEALLAREPAPLLIVDEAHNLPERARGYYSPRLELERLEALARNCGRARSGALRASATLLGSVAQHCRERAAALAQERSDPAPWVDAPERGWWQTLAERAESTLADCLLRAVELPGLGAARGGAPEEPRDPRLRDPLLEALGAVRDFGRFSALDPERFAALWSPAGVRLWCLDPAPFLRERLAGFHAAVFMSATLTPLAYHERALGIPAARAVRLELPSPFPRAHRALIAVDAVETTWRERSRDAAAVADLIERCAAVRPGNYLAFFPSFRYRDEVVAHLRPRATRVLLQLPGMPAEPILRQLERNRDAPLLVCGVHGGVLAEGVDYPGDLALGVFVVGPGLPQVCAEQELIRAYYERELGQGFEFAYLFPGLRRSVQAAGRALRRPDDRAVVLLLDRRFADPRYRQHLPGWWQEEIIDATDPLPALRAFWRRQPAPARRPRPAC